VGAKPGIINGRVGNCAPFCCVEDPDKLRN
jgi:hypothetical protein